MKTVVRDKTKILRGPSGLGDSVYLRPIVEHLVRRGEKLRVLSDYPDVFRGVDAEVTPFLRLQKPDVMAHYVGGKSSTTTTQFEDMCISAKIVEKIPFRFDWSVSNAALIDLIADFAAGRKVVVVHGGRTPMGRKDGFGAELLPQKPAFDAVLAALEGCFTVRVGGDTKYPLKVDLDLQGKTTVRDLLDIFKACDAAVVQCSFAVPMAEAFGKPLLAVWAAAGLKAKHSYVKAITPKKIFQNASSRHVFDDWPAEKIRESALAFRGI